MWLNHSSKIKIRSSKAFALEFFFGSSDRLGTDLVFLGTEEIWGQIRDIMKSEKSISKEIRNEDQRRDRLIFVEI